MGGWTALMWAADKGRVEVTTLLLEHGANPNTTGQQYSVYPIIWAAGRGHADIVKLLLQNGAKVNCSDKYGTTPLIWASRKGHFDCVMHLLENGADVDQEGANSMTALIVAVKGGYTDVVKELLKRNPNVNMTDKDGNTALMIAAKEGYTEIVQDLLDAGTYVNIPDRSGDTVLIGAVRGGHVEIVRALLHKYADIDIRGQPRGGGQQVSEPVPAQLAILSGRPPMCGPVCISGHDRVHLLLRLETEAGWAPPQPRTAHLPPSLLLPQMGRNVCWAADGPLFGFSLQQVLPVSAAPATPSNKSLGLRDDPKLSWQSLNLLALLLFLMARSLTPAQGTEGREFGLCPLCPASQTFPIPFQAWEATPQAMFINLDPRAGTGCSQIGHHISFPPSFFNGEGVGQKQQTICCTAYTDSVLSPTRLSKRREEAFPNQCDGLAVPKARSQMAPCPVAINSSDPNSADTQDVVAGPCFGH
ncbi:kinase D-interacting substrate of 220 kDa B-like protein [Lates japonicus]|uniref:Kinase D-interacting substrate of 220 kDa B-like protein n=1 Tax=Lates japonicus TaxID=270547 RepID=A0AAD3RMW5_LATJO|nr:kinase D-interacting substrate of 220 kDa B-like protein [Lates japonicus]